jgi:Skp family chaperone for outer membrane proteins
MPTGKRLTALLSLTVIAAAMLAWHAGANTAQRPPAQPTAIATIDIVEVFDRLNERTVLEEQLQTRLAARQAQVEEVRRRLQSIREDLDPATSTLQAGTEAYYERLREFTEQRAVAEARVRALEQIISIDRGTVRTRLYDKIRDAITRIAERDGLDAVLFDDSAFPLPENAGEDEVVRNIVTRSVIYRHESIDITERVITLMNNEYTAP